MESSFPSKNMKTLIKGHGMLKASSFLLNFFLSNSNNIYENESHVSLLPDFDAWVD